MQKNQDEEITQRDVTVENKWTTYLKNTQNKPPRGLVKKFVDFLKFDEDSFSKTQVVDVGCGAGNDTRFYSHVGFNVTAIDSNPVAIQNIQVNSQDYKNITTKICDITLESIPQCNIASASYCLPFVPPSLFDTTWNKHIVPNILPGGYFAGHFFGPEDGWAGSKDMTFLAENQVRELFNPQTTTFEGLTFFKEKKKEASLANGGSKLWHIFTVFARKKTVNAENDHKAPQAEALTPEEKTNFKLN